MSDTETTTTPPAITHADAILVQGALEEAMNEARYNPSTMLSPSRMEQAYQIMSTTVAATQGQP